MKLVLVIIVLIGLGTVVATIVVGTDTFDGVVNDEPFEQGLAWDAQRAAREATGVDVELDTDRFSVGANALRVGLRAADGARVSDAHVSVRTTRAHTAAFDHVVDLQAAADGAFRGSVDFAEAGHWELVFRVRRHDAEGVFVRRIEVSR